LFHQVPLAVEVEGRLVLVDPVYALRQILERAAALVGEGGEPPTPAWHCDAGGRLLTFWQIRLPKRGSSLWCCMAYGIGASVPNRSPRSGPSPTRPHLHAAGILLQCLKYARRFEGLDAFGASNPALLAKRECQLAMAGSHLDRGHFAEAEKLAAAASQSNPADTVAHLLLAASHAEPSVDTRNRP
jgi:hypothetical protein